MVRANGASSGASKWREQMMRANVASNGASDAATDAAADADQFDALMASMNLLPSASAEAWLCALLRLVDVAERAYSLLAVFVHGVLIFLNGFLFFLAALVFLFAWWLCAVPRG